MNILAFTPQAYGEIVTTSRKNKPAFTALNKVPKPAQAKEAGSFIKGVYQMLFVPGKEKVSRISAGSVYTESVSKHGAKRVAKKYDLWSRKPVEIVEDNRVTSLRNRRIINKDGSLDIEMRDMHTPDYRVGVRYNNVREVEGRFVSDIVNGDLKISYGEREVVLAPEQRENLAKKMNDLVTAKFGERFTRAIRHQEDGMKLLNDFHQDPDVIGLNILRSPKDLKKQLSAVPSSMPYGIEAIFAHI
ncbi:MAG: hypothetical protein K6E29_07220 [Cyanobacteria bacterium RUI128]|nr:hypothetical protein [Cyanobacteria bacterium RUI128]